MSAAPASAPTPGLEEIRLYDTRTRRVLPVVPLDPPRVGIYSCGPTVYAPQHIGNMRSQVMPDLLRRLLLAAGYDVTYVTNITDVGHLTSDADEGDDKMEAAAARTGLTAPEIAAHHTAEWEEDRRRLGCLEPDVEPRAADHIAEQIDLIQRLEAKGHTYVIADGVYFDVSTFPRYTELAGLDLDAHESTGRIENVADKRHPADFALWKLTPEGVKRQQEWDSPWGRGFPGWHIECSAMATRYLGERFDIHTGGVDHIGVHSTNEIAQSECALDVHPWVTHWMHSEFLQMAGEKISKSKGHVITVQTYVDEGIDPLALRYLFLQAHYRQQQDGSDEAVDAAVRAHRRLVQHAARLRTEAEAPGAPAPDPAVVDPRRRRFWEAAADDLNVPRALGIVWEVVRDESLTAADRWAFLLDADRLLGLSLASAEDPDAAAVGTGSDPRIDGQVAERERARTARDYATADRIRDELAAQGIEIVDGPDGPVWRRRG